MIETMKTIFQTMLYGLGILFLGAISFSVIGLFIDSIMEIFKK